MKRTIKLATIAIFLAFLMLPLSSAGQSQTGPVLDRTIVSIEQLSEITKMEGYRDGDPDNLRRYFMPIMEITTFTGQETKFDDYFTGGNIPVRYFAWDFESDGLIDYYTSKGHPAQHEFYSPGEYTTTAYAIDLAGNVSTGYFHVQVEYGSGQQTDELLNRPLTYRGLHRKDLYDANSASSTDSMKYALILSSGETDHFATAVKAYKVLRDEYGLEDSTIFFLVSSSIYESPSDDTLLVDIKDLHAELDTVANLLYERMGNDDILYVFSINHGFGRYDSTVYEYGLADACNYCAPHMGWGALTTESGDADLEMLESEWPMTYFFSYCTGAKTVGMNEWASTFAWSQSGSGPCWRRKLVSSFTDIQFWDEGGLSSDSDYFVEMIRQYCLGDVNHNGAIDNGEIADYDDDGNLPADTVNGVVVFDEDDWGDLELYEDDYMAPHLFDSLRDNYADYSYLSSGGYPLAIDITDSDNDGIFIGYDANHDSDLLDSIGIDEWGNVFYLDNNLDEFLDSLSYYQVHFIFTNCFSGGYINDISRDSVSVGTCTTEGYVGYNQFAKWFIDAMGDSSAIADVDSNSCVSILEAFNYSLGSTRYGTIERFDDNGDRMSHGEGLPTMGDGWSAQEWSWSDPCNVADTGCIGGDVNGNGVVNIADQIYLQDYLFYGGPAPVDPKTADLNMSCTIRISDLTRLIGYLFEGDPTSLSCGCD